MTLLRALMGLSVAGAIAAMALPAMALGDLENDGLIQQTVDIKGKAELEQTDSISSVLMGNGVASADRLSNTGEIIQKFTADQVTLHQDNTLGSTACLNCVLAGNPAAPNLGQ